MPAHGLALEYGLANGIAVVQVTGEVDVASCGVLRDSLLRIVADEGFDGLVVNLADACREMARRYRSNRP